MTNVPRALSSDCDYCVELSSAEATAAKQIIQQAQIDFDSIEEI
jgi:hypothetical protein